jgi:DNA-binding IclR family transcriptional regulator
VIQSLRRGLEVLEFMAARDGEATVTEVARVLSVDRSTSSRLLATLEARGFVEQDPDTQRYRLGTKLTLLSNVVLRSRNLGAVGHEVVRSLAESSGEGAHLAILTGADAVFIDHVDGRERLTINTSIGEHDPTYCTAIGRALLSGLSEDAIRELLADVVMKRFTRKTVTSIDRVVESARLVRQQGYAFDDEERHVGVQCVAAPVFDHTGRVVAAVGISGPTGRIASATERTIREVLSASRSLSTRLGFDASQLPHPSVLRIAQ